MVTTQPKRKLLPVRLTRLLPLPLLIALAVFALTWLGGLVRGPVVIDIGADDRLDRLYLSPGEGGFFESETQGGNKLDTNYRWAGRVSIIRLPWPLEAVPLKATLRATAPRPNIPPDQPSTLMRVTGENDFETDPIAALDMVGFNDGRDYTFQIPLHLRPNLDVYRLRFEASDVYLPGKGDPRGLAAIFFNLKLEPDYANFGWRGWLASFTRPGLLAVMTLACWGIAAHLYRRRAWISQTIAGVLLVVSMLLWPVEAEPLYGAWAFILVAAWLLLGLAAKFAQRAPNLPTPFVYTAVLFPLWPLAQFAFLRLNLNSLNPASVTLGVFTGALLYSAGMLVAAGNTESPVRNFERAFIWSVIIASVVSFAYNHFWVFQNDLYRGADFKVYYSALRDYEGGGPLYDVDRVLNQSGFAARMPPLFGPLMWPFVHIFGPNQTLALLTWRVVNELLLIPTLYVLFRIFATKNIGLRCGPAVLFLALNFGQISETIGYGQYNIIVLLGLALMALWVKENRARLAGGILALPVGIKLYPITSALYFLTESRYRKRGLVGLAVGGAALLILCGLTVGFDNVWFYATDLVFKVNKPEMDISNQSSFGFLARLAVPQVMADYKGEFPLWVIIGGYLIAIGTTAATVWVLWRKRGDEPGSNLQQLKLGALVLLSLIIPPFVWMHYVTPGLLALMALLVALVQPLVARWQLLIFAVCYGLLAYGGRNEFFFTEAVGLARWGSSYRFLAVVALWGLTLYLIWRSKKPVSATLE